jgi:formylglycine-generating enzyme required for sulfatase activity
MSQFEWIRIPDGYFTMGTSKEVIIEAAKFWSKKLLNESYDKTKFLNWLLKEYPQHRLFMDSFWIAKYPVTNGQYMEYLNENPEIIHPESIVIASSMDHPVWGVTVEDAKRFTNWLSIKLNTKVRLPKENEWEYAAKGETDNEYPYGKTFDPAKANTFESNIHQTTPVDYYEKYKSHFGLCDMAGNVEEWVDDRYQPYPGGVMIKDDLIEALGNRYQVLRGGSFARGGDLSRCARRHGPFPSPEFKFTGFRVAVDSFSQGVD